MLPPRALLLTLVLALAPLAGCFGATEIPLERTVSAQGGRVSEGWAYDGQGFLQATATLEGTASNPDNAGSFTVTFDLDGETWAITFDQFAQADGKDFMDGGVAFELDEHGDTGVADTSIPKIHATLAAWGKATVTRGGVPVVGQAGDLWSAHLMVSADTVRGADGRILKADGATPYDPATAGDALRVEGDPQVLFWIKSPDGEDARREPATTSQPVAFQGPSTTQTVAVDPGVGAASATINVTADGGSAPAGAGQLEVRVLDAAGEQVGNGGGNVLPGQPVLLTIPLEAAALKGPLTVELTGAGAFAARVDATVEYDDKPFLVFTWDEPVVS